MAARRKATKTPKEDVVPDTLPVNEGVSLEDTQSEPERVTVVTEVIEVVESEPSVESDTEEVSVEASVEPAENITEAEDEGMPETVSSVATPASDPVEPFVAKEEKQKDVVEGLFRKDTSPVTPEITIHRESKRLPLGLWIAIVVVVATLVGGGLIWATGSAGSLGMLSPADPTPTPQPTVAPTPAPQLNRSDITVEVLNGGGTPGAAGRMKAFLEEKGYTVSSTGNTEEYTYETTSILSTSASEAYLSLLQSDLESDYTVGTVSATLPDGSSADVQVIVGQEE